MYKLGFYYFCIDWRNPDDFGDPGEPIDYSQNCCGNGANRRPCSSRRFGKYKHDLNITSSHLDVMLSVPIKSIDSI